MTATTILWVEAIRDGSAADAVNIEQIRENDGIGDLENP